MSIITDFLKLFKYDPETDGASTFNIKQCLNDNWDKIDAWASGIKTTIAGLVPGTRKVNGKELSADVTLTGEDIKTSASDETTISSQLSNKVDNGSIGIPGDDCNNLENFGLYRVQTTTANCPVPAILGDTLINAPWDENTILQLFFGVSVGKIFWRRRIHISENPWSNWFPLANATPPQEFDLPLADGWIRVNAAEYWKTQEGVVIVTFRVAPENGAAIDTSSHTIAMLPEGFRPNGYTPHIAVSTMNPGTEIYDASAWVDNTGAIKARTRTSIPQSGGSSPTNWAGFAGTFVFVAAS